MTEEQICIIIVAITICIIIFSVGYFIWFYVSWNRNQKEIERSIMEIRHEQLMECLRKKASNQREDA